MSLLPRTFRPLRHRDFRLLWSGLATSLMGDGLWLVAIAFQVIELGGGPVQLSLIAAMYSVGLVAFVLLGGIVADRLPGRLIMISADLVRAVVVATLGILAVANGVEIWMLAAGGFVIGAAEAFFIPAYTALLPRLLDEEELLAANGLEGVVTPLAQQAAGPALGGLIVAALSPGIAILADAGTFLISAACLSAVHTQGVRPGAEVPSAPLAEMRAGWRYVRDTPWLWFTLIFALVAVLFILGPIEVLGPFAIREQTGGGATAYGLLLASLGVGAAAGALTISSRSMPRRYLTVMIIAWGFGALPLAVLGFAEEVWIMCAAVFIVGIGEGVGGVIWGTLLQRRVPDLLRVGSQASITSCRWR